MGEYDTTYEDEEYDDYEYRDYTGHPETRGDFYFSNPQDNK